MNNKTLYNILIDDSTHLTNNERKNQNEAIRECSYMEG